MKSGSLDVVYVHDDNLGSHAHYELFDSDEEAPEGYKALEAPTRDGASRRAVVDERRVDHFFGAGAEA